MATSVGIFLFSHHGDDKNVWRVGETIKRAIEKKAPYTFFLTAYALWQLPRIRPDVVEMIRWDSANIFTGWDKGKVEIGISCSHHMPVVQPGLPLEYWGAYFEGFAREQILGSKHLLEEVYHRTPRGFFPPEGMFAPACADLLQKNGLGYTILSGVFLHDDRWAKCQAYHQSPEYNHSDLKIVARVNDINPDCSYPADARAIKGMIKDYAGSNNVERVVLGCDIDLFSGNRGLPLNDGIARMCCIYDAISSDPDMQMVNVASIADGYQMPRNIYHLYAEHGIKDAHHYVNSWMDASGSLNKLDSHINFLVNEFIIHHTELLNAGKGCSKLEEAKQKFFWGSGMEFRHKDWNQCLLESFYSNYGPARDMLFKL